MFRRDERTLGISTDSRSLISAVRDHARFLKGRGVRIREPNLAREGDLIGIDGQA